MPTILEQLRAAQRDAGITAPTHPEEEVVIPGMISALDLTPNEKPFVAPIIFKRVNGAVPTGVAGGGYIKIFPPTFQTIRDISPEWLAANWTTPSPWCRVEGLPDHPEFEANLAGTER